MRGNQASKRKTPLALLATVALILLLAVTPVLAGAEDTVPDIPADQPAETAVVVSNTVRLSDLIAATEGEEEQEALPEGNTRIAINWLSDNTYAPDSIMAVLGAASGTPISANLTRAGGWVTAVDFDQSAFGYYTLVGVSSYTVTVEEGAITFEVSDVFEAPEEEIIEPVESELEISFTVSRGGEEVAFSAFGIMFGDMVHFTGSFDAAMVPEGATYRLQWQYNAGLGWMDIDGATDAAYSYFFSPENLNWNYRLLLIVEQQAGQIEAFEAAGI